MKKIILFFVIIFPDFLGAQCHSWDGKELSPHSSIRCLNIFINVIYDIHPEANNSFTDTLYWPPVNDPHRKGINNYAVPNYLLDWMDTVYLLGAPSGFCTRLYGESSFDNFQIVGDFIVVNILESFIIDNGGFDRYGIPKAAIKMINAHGFETIFNHNSLDDYDFDNNDSLDFVNILIRNISSQYGGG